MSCGGGRSRARTAAGWLSAGQGISELVVVEVVVEAVQGEQVVMAASNCFCPAEMPDASSSSSVS
jgi:hypothetical protein